MAAVDIDLFYSGNYCLHSTGKHMHSHTDERGRRLSYKGFFFIQHVWKITRTLPTIASIWAILSAKYHVLYHY